MGLEHFCSKSRKSQHCQKDRETLHMGELTLRTVKTPCYRLQQQTKVHSLGLALHTIENCTKFTDRSTGLRFLVDTGAEVSVVPPSRTERKNQQNGFSLQAVNNTAIATYGKGSLTLDLGLRRTFRWVFVIADVKNPILGADFLRNYSLLVDMRRNRLSDALTQLKVQGIASHVLSPSPTVLPRRPLTEFESILSESPSN